MAEEAEELDLAEVESRDEQLKFAVVQGMYAMAELWDMILVDAGQFRAHVERGVVPKLNEEETKGAAILYAMSFWTEENLKQAKEKGAKMNELFNPQFDPIDPEVDDD